MEIKELPIEDLIPYENNPRINEDAVVFVMESIREFTFVQPIVVDENKVIVIGHTRWEASKRLGRTTVPVYQVSLPPEKIRALRLVDNKTSEHAYWDQAKEKEEIKAIIESDLDFSPKAFGWEGFELDSAFGDDDEDTTIHDNSFDDEGDLDAFSAVIRINFETAKEKAEFYLKYGIDPKLTRIAYQKLKVA